MAITALGYHRETFEEILNDLTAKTRELFGEDIDVSDQTPLGKLLNIMAYVRGKDHEEAELIFYSRYPNSAEGLNLDRLTPFVGLRRNPAVSARYRVTVTGDDGTVIPNGFIVATESGIQFYNTEQSTIEQGQAVIIVECSIPGTMGNINPSDITQVVNPQAGVTSVLGTSVVIDGEDEESDYDLRKRIAAVNENVGTGTATYIRSELLKVLTVKSATVIENNTDEVDSMGNTPHSIACYVSGGEDYSQEIGEAIFNAKAAGINTNGDIEVTVVDIAGNSHIIRYNQMEEIPVSVAITITTTDDFDSATGIPQIQGNITGFINNLAVGDDVILSALYGYIYAVKGVLKVQSLTLNGDTNDITVFTLQSAICEQVTVTEV